MCDDYFHGKRSDKNRSKDDKECLNDVSASNFFPFFLPTISFSFIISVYTIRSARPTKAMSLDFGQWSLSEVSTETSLRLHWPKSKALASVARGTNDLLEYPLPILEPWRHSCKSVLTSVLKSCHKANQFTCINCLCCCLLCCCLLFYCFTFRKNSYGHVGTVSLLNHNIPRQVQTS